MPDTKKVLEKSTFSSRSLVCVVLPQPRSIWPSRSASAGTGTDTGTTLICSGTLSDSDSERTIAWHTSQVKPPGLPAASIEAKGAALLRTPSEIDRAAWILANVSWPTGAVGPAQRPLRR